MMSPEGRRFECEMANARMGTGLAIIGRKACDCGCGAPDRVQFTIGEFTAYICNPAGIDAAIEALREIRRRLWGEPCP